MKKKNSTFCINPHLCSKLLSKLKDLENKYDRIIIELSDVKKQVASLSERRIDLLIDSIQDSAKAMQEQSLEHRKYVERCISGKASMHLIRRENDGL